MATLGNAGRVGLVALLAITALCIGWFWQRGSAIGSHTYSFDVLFDDARGVTADTPVQLAGVQIGKVSRVALTPTQQADLTLQIQDKVAGRPVRIPRGSKFLIVTTLLGQSGTVTVLPPPPGAQIAGGDLHDGETDLRGEPSTDLSKSFAQANTLLAQVTQTTKKVDTLLDNFNSLAGDKALKNGLTGTVGNLNAASANGLKLTGKLNGLLTEDNAQVLALLKQTGVGAQASIANLTETTASIRDTTRENRAQIAAIVRNLNDTTSAVAGITGQTNNALKNGGVTQNLEATVANLKATTDKINATVGNFQSLSGDPKVQSNLRETVQNIRDSTEQTTLLLERLNKLAGTKPRKAAVIVAPPGTGLPTVVLPGTSSLPPVTPAPALGAPFYLPRVDAVYNTRDRHFRTDVDAVVPLSTAPVTFARVGVYGLADNSRFILQAGRGLDKNGLLDARAGIYASKLSVGGDLGLGRRTTLSLDLYDPNNYKLDARGVLLLAPELGLVVGGENLNHKGAGALLGLEYRQSR